MEIFVDVFKSRNFAFFCIKVHLIYLPPSRNTVLTKASKNRLYDQITFRYPLYQACPYLHQNLQNSEQRPRRPFSEGVCLTPLNLVF